MTQPIDRHEIHAIINIAESALADNGFRSVSETLDRVADFARSVTNAADVIVRIRDPEGANLVYGGQTYSALTSHIEVQSIGDETYDQTIAGRLNPSVEVYRNGQPQFVDVEAMKGDSVGHRRLASAGIQRTHYGPVISRGEVVGVITCYWRSPEDVAERTEEWVEMIGRLAGVSFHTAVMASRAREHFEAQEAAMASDVEQLDAVQREASAYRHLLSAVGDNPTFTPANWAAAMSAVLGTGVVLLDDTGAELGTAGPSSAIEHLRTRASASLEQEDDDAVEVRVLRVSTGRPILGHALFGPLDQPWPDDVQLMVEYSCALVVNNLALRHAARKTLPDIAERSLLVNILTSSLPRPDLKRIEPGLGLSPTCEYRLVGVRCLTPEAAFRRSMEHRRFTGDAGPPVLAAAIDNDAVFVVPADARWSGSDELAAIAAVPGEGVACSDRFVGLATAARSYGDLLVALRLSTHSTRPVEVSSIGTWSGLIDSFSEGQAGLLAAGVVQPLERAQRESGVPLLATVDAWISCEGNLKDTAHLLSIHENTVRQRLSTVEDVVGFPVRSFHGMTQLLLAMSTRKPSR